MDFISIIISKLKKEKYVLDPSIPKLYIIAMVFQKCFMFLYGMLRLQTTKRVFIHPSSRIKCSSKIHFGNNLMIAEDCYINALSKEGLFLGDNVSIGYQTHIELTGSLKHLAKKMIIGSNVGLGTHGHYGSGVGGLEIGDYTIIGNYVSFHPENHIYDDLSTPIKFQGVTGKGIKIGENCWIGAKATILDGTILGDGCIVAASSVVRGVFPENVIIGGIPAKIIKKRA